jgi:hypothetical protein
MNDRKHWYVFIDEGEYFKTGQITSFIGNDFVVVRLEKDDMPGRSELFSLEYLAMSDTLLFETKQEFDTWLAWLEAPSKETKPKIVKFNPKDIH